MIAPRRPARTTTRPSRPSGGTITSETVWATFWPRNAPTKFITAAAMPQLQSMQSMEEYWIEINRLENLGDKSYRRILAKLFSGKYEALEVLKLKDVVDSLEAAIDAFERVANIVEQIAVKES